MGGLGFILGLEVVGISGGVFWFDVKSTSTGECQGNPFIPGRQNSMKLSGQTRE